jgi:predicted amidohydrolase YtcJ
MSLLPTIARTRRARCARGAALVTGLFFASCGGSEPTEPADTIYHGGPIVTVDDDNSTAEALAVRDGRIVAVGSEDGIMAMRASTTDVVDLEGRTLAPGFVDGHAHVAQFGIQAIGANLLAAPDGEVETVEDLVAALQRWAADNPQEIERFGVIFGVGYDDAVLGRHPTRDDLDQVSTDVPVLAGHISGHFSAVNSAGLELFGYSADSEDPPGGVIRRRAGSREPNGVLEELASIPKMMAALSPRTSEDALYTFERGVGLAKSFGYTTAQEGRAFAPTHQGLVTAAEAGLFDIDVVSYIDYTDRQIIDGPWHTDDYGNGYRVGGLKITLDGSPQGRTAWRTEPYLIPPEGQPDDYLGYPAIEDDAVVAGVVQEAYEKGWQTLVHANGDAAVDQLIRTFRAGREAAGADGSEGLRNVLIHGQYVREDQLDDLVELDMIASLFPMHTFYWGDWHAQIIGEEKGQFISPTRTALDKGLVVTSHTDAPVALPNLMQVMWATVNRVSRTGQVIGPDQRVTPEEALRMITINAAYQHFEEDRKGSLEVGKLADMVVLSDNPLSVDPMEINQIQVMETIKEGETVFRR